MCVCVGAGEGGGGVRNTVLRIYILFLKIHVFILVNLAKRGVPTT